MKRRMKEKVYQDSPAWILMLEERKAVEVVGVKEGMMMVMIEVEQG